VGRQTGQVFAVEELTDCAAAPEEAVEVAAVAENLAASVVDRFHHIPNLVRRPRPAVGKNHKLYVWIAGKRYLAVKDTGACVTTIPESVALEVLNRCLHLDSTAKDYPVMELCHYDEAIRLQGFAAGQVVSVKHGAILRTVFRGVDGTERSVPVEYRVIPEEADTGRMILLGARTIGPEGLDVHTTTSHHEVRKLGIRCERAPRTRTFVSSRNRPWSSSTA